MPRFFEQPAIPVGTQGQQYELDGAVLQALLIATNDYIPPGTADRPCWGSPQAHRYRVIRQGDIIFVQIDEDLEACGLQYIVLDSGVTYAISTDGRILRRILGSDPEAALYAEPPQPGGPPPPDGGTPPATPDAGAGAPSPEPPPAAPSLPDGGTPPAP